MRSKGPASKSCGKKSSHQRLQNKKHIDHMLLKSTSTKPQVCILLVKSNLTNNDIDL